MNVGLVDLIATIRGIVRRPTDFTIQLFQILVQFPRASFLSIFFFTIPFFLSHLDVISNTCPFHDARYSQIAIASCHHAARLKVKLSRNHRGQ